MSAKLSVSGIMTCLTKKNSGYEGGKLPDKACSAFLFLKNKLCESPIVSHPKRGLDFHLATDAAAGDDTYPGGFGAVLTQIWQDNSEHVIAYTSRSLKQNEENCSAYLLELAALWGIDYVSVYFEYLGPRQGLYPRCLLRSHCAPEHHFEHSLLFHKAEVQGLLVYPLRRGRRHR